MVVGRLGRVGNFIFKKNKIYTGDTWVNFKKNFFIKKSGLGGGVFYVATFGKRIRKTTRLFLLAH